MLDITQLSFHMSLTSGLGAISYSLNNAHVSGQDSRGQSYTLVADILVTTAAYASQCPNADEGIIEVYITSASALDFSGNPAQPTDPHPQWVRTGQYLIDYQPPQNVPCGETRFNQDHPLIVEMVSTATPD